MRPPFLLLLPLSLSLAMPPSEQAWQGKTFPDIRGKDISLCRGAPPKVIGYMPYVCDPDAILNKTEIALLNNRLHNLALETPCKCQRPSQCTTDDAHGKPFFLGFVVAVALVKKLQLTIHEPSAADLDARAEKFCSTLRGRWALGDCGNSAIIFVWEKYKKVYISPGRLTELYVTQREIEVILSQAQHHVDQGNYANALIHIMENIQMEMNGDPEKPLDIGQWSLILAVAIALVFVSIITGCVCAFRCCGNMRPEVETPLGRTIERIDSFKAELVRRGSQLRRSFSRSPKLPQHSPPRALHNSNAQSLLGYEDETTMV